MHISSQFDSGNINVVRAESPEDILLTIPKDNQSEFAQWFHFRLVGETFITHKMTIPMGGRAITFLLLMTDKRGFVFQVNLTAII